MMRTELPSEYRLPRSATKTIMKSLAPNREAPHSREKVFNNILEKPMKPAAIFFLLVTAAPALAQDIAVDTVGIGTTQQFFEPLSGDLMVTDSRSTIDVFEGLDDTPLAGMTARCFGSTTILRGVPRGNGNCVFTDPEGDKVLQSWAVDQVGQGTSSGTWFFVGGTGKHEGIVGRGHFNRFTQNTSGKTETHISGEARWQ